MTSAQSNCTEASRAAALASHSAASMAAAAGFREVARLLRSSEALARAATAALLALRQPDAAPPAHGGDAAAKRKKRRPKKKKDADVVMDGTGSGPEALQLANDVDVAGVVASSSTLSPSAADFVPASGKATRVLAARISRERSPHGARATPPAAAPSTSSHKGATSAYLDTDKFVEGQAVVLADLVSRSDLVGKCGVVKSFDSASGRYAVSLDASGEQIRVLGTNLRPSIFASAGGIG